MLQLFLGGLSWHEHCFIKSVMKTQYSKILVGFLFLLSSACSSGVGVDAGLFSGGGLGAADDLEVESSVTGEVSSHNIEDGIPGLDEIVLDNDVVEVDVYYPQSSGGAFNEATGDHEYTDEPIDGDLLDSEPGTFSLPNRPPKEEDECSPLTEDQVVLASLSHGPSLNRSSFNTGSLAKSKKTLPSGLFGKTTKAKPDKGEPFAPSRAFDDVQSEAHVCEYRDDEDRYIWVRLDGEKLNDLNLRFTAVFNEGDEYSDLRYNHRDGSFDLPGVLLQENDSVHFVIEEQDAKRDYSHIATGLRNRR